MKFLSYLFFLYLFMNSLYAQSTLPIKPLNRNVQSVIQSIANSEREMGKKMDGIILNVKSYSDINMTGKSVLEAISQIKDLANKNPNSDTAQLYRLAVENIPLFKGFVYRMRKVVETSDIGYISSIYLLRKFKQSAYFRAEYMDALFELLTTPNDGEEILGQKGIFENSEEMQDWLITKLAPLLAKNISEMKAILSKHKVQDPLYLFDVKLLVGKSTLNQMLFESDKVKVVTAGHLYGLVSMVENYLGLLHYVGSYNLNALGDFYNLIAVETFKGKKSTFSKRWAMTSHVTGLVSSARISQILNSPNEFGPSSGKGDDRDTDHQNFLTIRAKAKQNQYFDIARKYFVDAIKDQIIYHRAMISLGGDKDASYYIINPETYKRLAESVKRYDVEAILNKSLEMLSSNDTMTLNDRIIKKKYSINASAMFDMNKMNDLRKFFPNRFVDDWEKKPSEPPMGAALINSRLEEYKKTFVWNYNYGKPLSWPDPTFGGLLPNGKKGGLEDEFVLHLTNVSSQPEIPYIGMWLSLFYLY